MIGTKLCIEQLLCVKKNVSQHLDKGSTLRWGGGGGLWGLNEPPLLSYNFSALLAISFQGLNSPL